MSLALNVIAKPTMVLICAAVLSMLLRRSSASMRHAAWILALASAVLLPIVVLVVPQFELPILPKMRANVPFLPGYSVPDGAASAGRVLQTSGLLPATSPVPKTLWLQPGFVWVLGVSLLSLRLLMGTIALRRLRKSAVRISAGSWPDLIRELSIVFRVGSPVRLLLSDLPVSPMTWGLVRHTILLPSTAVGWPEERRRLVLAHELAHSKRHDGLIQIFVHIVCGVYWFNPLVWYAAHRIRIERERACDDHVLSLGAVAADYADHLIQVVRGLRAERSVSCAALSMAQPSQLERRLASILDSRARRRQLSRVGALLLCALAGLLTVSVAAIGVTAAVPAPPVLAAAMKSLQPTPAPKPAAGPAAAPQRTRIGNADAAPTTSVTPPQILESFPPVYTPEAVAANAEGTVTLEGQVDIQGQISGLRVIKGLGYGLDRKAIDAVLGNHGQSPWKFGPALRNGQPVESITQIEVDFRIPPWYQPASEITTNLYLSGDDMAAIRVGPGVTPPTVTFRVEPQYTPEAREAKYRGKVVVAATVHQNGRLTVDKIVQDLEYGLTEKAIEAIEQWKFKPGTRDGHDVPISLNIEVNFNLK